MVTLSWEIQNVFCYRLVIQLILSFYFLGWMAAVSLAAEIRDTDAPTSGGLPVSPELESKLETIREQHGVPALAAASSVDGELVRIAATGIRRTGYKERVQPDDRFHVGSCTKAMTATMLARLVERGTLRWELTLGEAFPDLADSMHADYRAVTLWQLMQHLGGMPANPDAGGLWLKLMLWQGSTTDAREEVARLVLSQPPAVEPGAEMLYSNTGYTIAGLIAERATDKSWEQLMEEELFGPLDMDSAGFGPPGMQETTEQPWGHNKSLFGGYTPVFADNPSAIGPAGAVHLSLADWANFAAVHTTGKDGYLRPETLQKLHDPGDGDYAAGWMVVEREWAGGKALTHTGSNTMWYAVIWIAPKTRTVYMATTNCGSQEGFAACDAAIGALIGD